MEFMTIFILSTSGLTWILTKSKLFKSYREHLTRKLDFYNAAIINFRSITNSIKYGFYWMFDSLFSCSGCMGFWSGILNYLLIYQKMDIKLIAFGFAGSVISLIMIQLYDFLRK